MITTSKSSAEAGALYSGALYSALLANMTKKRSRNQISSASEEADSTKDQKTGQTLPASELTATQLRNARKRRAKQRAARGHTGQQITDKQNADDPSALYAWNPRRAPLVIQSQRFFQNEVDVDFPIHLGASKGWRTLAKLAVRSNDEGLSTIGLFAPGSHKIRSIPHCTAHHPSLNKAVTVLQELGRRLEVEPFEETTGTGHLRHVALSVDRRTGAVQVTVVWNGSTCSDNKKSEVCTKLNDFCQAIVQAGTSANMTISDRKTSFTLHSLWVHTNSAWKHDNAIFSIDQGIWEHRHGPDTGVQEYLWSKKKCKQTVPLFFPPTVFRQANLDAFATIVREIREYLVQSKPESDSKHCLELYGGVGTIGLHIADLTKSLICSDENPHNQACFERSRSKLPEEVCNRVRYEPKSATDMIERIPKADWVIVDPPRKGLDTAVLQAFVTRATNPSVLVYVSCGFDAFVRDCRMLLKDGGWKITHASGHILFPGSNAIETLAIFER